MASKKPTVSELQKQWKEKDQQFVRNLAGDVVNITQIVHDMIDPPIADEQGIVLPMNERIKFIGIGAILGLVLVVIIILAPLAQSAKIISSVMILIATLVGIVYHYPKRRGKGFLIFSGMFVIIAGYIIAPLLSALF